MALTDLASFRREFYRLTNTDSADTALTEHDSTGTENVDQLLAEGLRSAQDFLVGKGLGPLWARSDALTVTGSDPERYAALQSDFLKLAGDEHNSPVRQANGDRWGRLVSYEDRHLQGSFFHLRGDGAGGWRLYFGRRATIPTDLSADIVYRVGALAVGVTVDFPEDDRALIPAYAAVRASSMPWFTGGDPQKAALQRYLDAVKADSVRRARRSRQPTTFRATPVVGDRGFI